MLATRPTSPSNCQLPSSHAQYAALTRNRKCWGCRGCSRPADQPTNQPTNQTTKQPNNQTTKQPNKNQPTSLLAGVKPRAGASKNTPVPHPRLCQKRDIFFLTLRLRLPTAKHPTNGDLCWGWFKRKIFVLLRKSTKHMQSHLDWP